MRCGDLDDPRFMELFELAISLPAGFRRSRLVEACHGDAELADDLAARVGRYEQMGDFLLRPPLSIVGRDVRFAPAQLVSGRFLIAREIAEGGMAVVYEAVDQKVERRCALKCPKPGFARRLPKEARAALSITHDNVCRIYGIHTAESAQGPVDVLAMEYLDGETLTERLARVRRLDDPTAREIARQLCAGLSAAHREDVLHRDLKSNNIMLTTSSAGLLRVVITDFGLAGQLTEGGGAGSGVMAGTLPFMAPELLDGGSATKSSDLYALGVVLYEMITGRLPVWSEPGGQLVPPSRLVSGIHRRWDRAVGCCLTKNPDDRATTTVEDVDGMLRVSSRRRVAPLVATAAVVASLVGPLATRPPAPPRIKLAVLPFAAAASDGELAGIGNGILHDLSDRLNRLASRDTSLLVIPTSEAARYNVTQPERARATLGATHVLSGTIERNGQSLRVRSSLIDARTLIILREMSAVYPEDRLSDVPLALAGTVTGALNLAAMTGDEPIDPLAYSSFVEGTFHLRAGLSHADAAVEHLERAVRADPSSARVSAALAEAYIVKYDSTRDEVWLERARARLEIAESHHPDVAEVRLASGRLNRVWGRHDKAIEDYKRAIQLEASNVAAWVGLARAYEGSGTRHADAADAYQRAVEIRPDYYLPHLEFGAFYYMRGHYGQAEHQYQRAIAGAPDNPIAHSNLGGLYADLGRYPEAETMLRRSLALEETNMALTNLGAVLNYEGRDSEALTLHRKAAARGPRTFVLMLNIGDSCRRLGLAAEATDAYRQGLELADRDVLKDPGNAYARAFVAYFMARLDTRDPALRELEQALRLTTNDGKVLRRAALTFECLRDRARTLEVLKAAPLPVLKELSRHPDLRSLAADPAFKALMENARTT